MADTAWGNQAGINYAVEYLEADYIIIANPDIHVTPRCIERVKHALDNTEDAVMASAGWWIRRGRICSPTGPCCLCGKTCWTPGLLPDGCLRPC